MNDTNTTQKLDKRILAREHRVDLDEEVQTLERKGWVVDQDAEPNPYRPNPSCPPWPTIVMVRPIDHPEALNDWRERAIKLQNQVGEMAFEFSELRKLYGLVAGILVDGGSFINRAGIVAIRDEPAWDEALAAILVHRERFGPKQDKTNQVQETGS